MPFITISTLFLLAGVFTGGCLLSWFLNDRKNERERARMEDSMTRALERRYEVYEDLEKSFHRVFASMDEVRERWSEQMASVQQSVDGSLGQTTFVREGVEELVGRVDAMGAELHAKMEAVLAMADEMPAMVTDPSPRASGEFMGPVGFRGEPSHALMRVENPELWDLEREYERRNAEQLAEISAKSRRVQELMDKIDALEPVALQLQERDAEFVALEAGHGELESKLEQLERESEELAKTNRALEETRRARVAELTQRVEELEVVEVEAGELRKLIERQRSELDEQGGKVTDLECKYTEVSVELDGVRKEHTTAVEVAAVERVRFERELDDKQQTVERLNASITELEQTVRDLHAKVEGLEERAASLTSELNSRDEILADREQSVSRLQAELTGLQSELEQRAQELDERERKFEELQGAWRMATGQVELQRSKLASHMNHFHAAQEMLSQLKPMLEELETRLTTEDEDGGSDSQGGLSDTTVVVSGELEDSADMVVNDGSLEELPDEASEILAETGIDELPAALPGQEPRAEERPKVKSDFTSDGFDLSQLDDISEA